MHRQAVKREMKLMADATKSELLNIKENAKKELKEMKERNKQEMKQLVWDRHAVLQYTLEGEFVREWRCASDAQKATGIMNISKCLNGITDHAGNFIWKYKVER